MSKFLLETTVDMDELVWKFTDDDGDLLPDLLNGIADRANEHGEWSAVVSDTAKRLDEHGAYLVREIAAALSEDAA